MTVNLSEPEREVWKAAYSLHEQFHELSGDPAFWEVFAKTVFGTIAGYPEGTGVRRLAEKLLMALYEYASEEQKIRQDAERAAPMAEQATMWEAIPWT